MSVNGVRMSANGTKCPEKANGIDRISPHHAPIYLSSQLASRPAVIDRRKKKRHALRVEERSEGREGDFTCPFPVFMPAWTI